MEKQTIEPAKLARINRTVIPTIGINELTDVACVSKATFCEDNAIGLYLCNRGNASAMLMMTTSDEVNANPPKFPGTIELDSKISAKSNAPNNQRQNTAKNKFGMSPDPNRYAVYP